MLVMLQMISEAVFWLMLRAIHQHPILHLHPDLTIKGKEMMKIVFLDLKTTNAGILGKDCHSLKEIRFYSSKQKRKACLKWNSVRQ